MAAPIGIGLYIRAIRKSKHGTPKQLADRLAGAGVSWVAIGGPWHDNHGERWMNRPPAIRRYSTALLRAGVEPHIWGFPWHDRVELFVAEMTQSTLSDVTAGWLLDPELGFKRRDAKASELFDRSRDAVTAINPSMLLGMTSYGLPRGHRTFPFDAFAEPGQRGEPTVECDYGSPQLYFVPERRVKEGLADYAEIGFDEVVPSFGNYKFVRRDPSKPLSGENRRAVAKTPAELQEHMSHFVDSDVPVRGMIGWAYNFVTRGQWAVLERWSNWLARGACSLPSR